MAIKINITKDKTQTKWFEVNNGEFMLYKGRLYYAWEDEAIDLITRKSIDIDGKAIVEVVDVEINVVRK